MTPPGPRSSDFGLPAVVNGATHANDGVATNAKADLTTAYNVAAAAQLTGPLVLNAQGNANAVRPPDQRAADHSIG